MARRLPWGSLPDGTILGFADAQRAAHRDMLESARQRQQLERRLSHEDDPVCAARLRGVIREMQPQLEQAGVDVQGALDDSFKHPPSPTRRDSDALWNQIWATEEESPHTSAEDQGYQTASTCNTDGSPDASCTSGGSARYESQSNENDTYGGNVSLFNLDADMMLVDRPLPQHIFVPTWVYFARQRYSDLWKTILRHYFTHYRWPKFHTMPQWFIQACFNNGIAPDKFERTPGFAPVWVFYMRDLVKDRVLDKEWFQYCITEFFNNGSFPNFEDMPDELQNMCAQDDISENDFVEVVGA